MLFWNLMLFMSCVALYCAARCKMKLVFSECAKTGSEQTIYRCACDPGTDARIQAGCVQEIHRLAGPMLGIVKFDTRPASMIAVGMQRAFIASAYSAARCNCHGYPTDGSIESG